jgi:sn-glycerol 3-phosphate transport system permease protein
MLGIRKRSKLGRGASELGRALPYMAPAILFIAAFSYFPFLKAIYLSFFTVNRNTFLTSRFIGLGYYARIFNIGDSAFGDTYLRSLLVTAEFALMVVLPSIAAALALALLAKAKLKRIGIFRTIFMSGIAISIAGAGVIWSLIYSPNVKLFQWLMELLRLNSTSILTDARTALPAVALTTIWTALGFNFIVALAGLQSIPSELYESGMIDGAGPWASFRRITLPMLGPTLLFLLLMNTVSSFQAFTQFKVLIDSVGPNQSTNVFVYAIFNSFWMENNYGFASAMSVVLFLAVLGMIVFQFRLDRTVHYQ